MKSMPIFAGAPFFLCFCCGLTVARVERGGRGENDPGSGRFQGRVIVHVGCGDGRVTAASGGAESCTVHGLDSSDEKVVQACEYIRGQRLGDRLAVTHWTPPECHMPTTW